MSGAGDWGTDKARGKLQSDTPGQHKQEMKMSKTKVERFKPYFDRNYPRIIDFYIQFRGGKGDRITSPENKKDYEKALKMCQTFIRKNKIKSRLETGTPEEGSSAYKISLILDNKKPEFKVDLRPLVDQISKLKTAEDHGGGYDKPLPESVDVIDENLRKQIAQLSKKFPEGSKVKIKRNNKIATVLSVGKDYVKVGIGKRTMDHKPSELLTASVDESIDGRTKAFREKVAKLAYKKNKLLKAQFPELLDISKIDNPLKGFPYNEKMTKEHSEELMNLLKVASGTGMSHQELMDSMTNWMEAKGYKNK